MRLSDNELWQEDIDKTLSGLDLSSLSGSRIMITGCTGLICSAVADILIRWNACHDKKIAIYAVSRNIDAVRERFEPYSAEQWFEAAAYDAALPVDGLGADCDYIIHGAGNASPRNIVREPVETMYSNIIGLKNLLEYSRKNRSRRLLYISSSEIYGCPDKGAPLGASGYGYIDILNPRSSYPVSKCAGETLCVSYAAEYGVDSVIVRPGHIYGPTAKKDDSRVSSAWAYAAARGEDIVMKSDGSQVRSYCYAMDAASAILTVLVKGRAVRAYNISNPDSVLSIKEMAKIMARAGYVSVRYEAPSEAERKGFNPMPNSSLDASELIELGWEGKFDAEQGMGHTIKILRACL